MQSFSLFYFKIYLTKIIFCAIFTQIFVNFPLVTFLNNQTIFPNWIYFTEYEYIYFSRHIKKLVTEIDELCFDFTYSKRIYFCERNHQGLFPGISTDFETGFFCLSRKIPKCKFYANFVKNCVFSLKLCKLKKCINCSMNSQMQYPHFSLSSLVFKCHT